MPGNKCKKEVNEMRRKGLTLLKKRVTAVLLCLAMLSGTVAAETAHPVNALAQEESLFNDVEENLFSGENREPETEDTENAEDMDILTEDKDPETDNDILAEDGLFMEEAEEDDLFTNTENLFWPEEKIEEADSSISENTMEASVSENSLKETGETVTLEGYDEASGITVQVTGTRKAFAGAVSVSISPADDSAVQEMADQIGGGKSGSYLTFPSLTGTGT